MIENSESIKLIRSESRKYAVQCFGYNYIFNQRARLFGSCSTLLKISGILVPAILAATVISFELNQAIKSTLIIVLSIASVFSFGLSVYAIIMKWDENLSYSYEASQAYDFMYYQFDKISKFPADSFSEMSDSFTVLLTEYRTRMQQNGKYNISEKERRKGMRYTLREHSQACVGCNKIPLDMKSSDCPVCGNF